MTFRNERILFNAAGWERKMLELGQQSFNGGRRPALNKCAGVTANNALHNSLKES